MNTRDVILVGAGAVVGYLLVAYLKNNKSNSETTETVVETDTVVPVVDQAKIDKCNKEADDYMAVIRPSAGADLGAIRKERFDACIARKA